MKVAIGLWCALVLALAIAAIVDNADTLKMRNTPRIAPNVMNKAPVPIAPEGENPRFNGELRLVIATIEKQLPVKTIAATQYAE